MARMFVQKGVSGDEMGGDLGGVKMTSCVGFGALIYALICSLDKACYPINNFLDL